LSYTEQQSAGSHRENPAVAPQSVGLGRALFRLLVVAIILIAIVVWLLH
jgi:hypothetical protein